MEKPKSEQHVKVVHRALFVAFRKDVRRHPGGYPALASEMGRTGVNAHVVLSGRFNPDDLGHSPTAKDILDMLETLRAGYAQNVLSGYGSDRVDFSEQGMTEADRATFCLRQIGELADVIRAKSEAVADGKVDRREHREIANLLRPLLPELTAFCDAVEE